MVLQIEILKYELITTIFSDLPDTTFVDTFGPDFLTASASDQPNTCRNHDGTYSTKFSQVLNIQKFLCGQVLNICKNFIYVAGLRVYIILGGGGACEGGDPLDTRQNFSQNFSSSSSIRNIKLEEGLHPQVYSHFL